MKIKDFRKTPNRRMSKFAQALEKIRREASISMARAARLSGYSYDTWTSWERGRRLPVKHHWTIIAERIARILAKKLRIPFSRLWLRATKRRK